MKHFLGTYFAPLFFLSLLAHGTSFLALAEPLSKPMTASEIPASLAEEAREFVHELSRDIYVYHFAIDENNPSLYLPPVSATAARHINMSIQNNIWDPEVAAVNGGWFGGGVYASANPIASRGFGSKNANHELDTWILYQIRLKKGQKILDITDPNSTGQASNPNLSFRLREAMQREYKCQVTRLFDLFNTAWKAVGCKRVSRDLLSALDIASLAYTWKFYPENLGDPERYKSFCPNSRFTAFYLTDRTGLSAKDIKVFTARLPPQGEDAASSDRIFIESMYRKFYPWRTLWPDLTLPSKDFDLKKSMQTRLLTCGDAAEDMHHRSLELAEKRAEEESQALLSTQKGSIELIKSELRKNKYRWSLPAADQWEINGNCQELAKRLAPGYNLSGPQFVLQNSPFRYFNPQTPSEALFSTACGELVKEREEQLNRAVEALKAELNRSLSEGEAKQPWLRPMGRYSFMHRELLLTYLRSEMPNAEKKAGLNFEELLVSRAHVEETVTTSIYNERDSLRTSDVNQAEKIALPFFEEIKPKIFSDLSWWKKITFRHEREAYCYHKATLKVLDAFPKDPSWRTANRFFDNEAAAYLATRGLCQDELKRIEQTIGK